MSEPAAGIRGRAERLVWRVRMPAGGWASPWPQALELAEHLTPGSWTLVGGLMVQLHALHAGLEPPRTTVDVDVLLHIETRRRRGRRRVGSWPGSGTRCRAAWTRALRCTGSSAGRRAVRVSRSWST